MARASITSETRLGKMDFSVFRKLSMMLDVADAWKDLVQHIKKTNGDPKYTSDHVLLFEMEKQRINGSATRRVLEDWSTQNVNVGQLLQVLIEAKLYRAANFISVDVLNGPSISEDDMDPQTQKNHENTGPSLGVPPGQVPVQNTDSSSSNSSLRCHEIEHHSMGGNNPNNLQGAPSVSEQDTVYVRGDSKVKERLSASIVQDIIEGLTLTDELKHFEYLQLEKITNNFNNTPVKEKGNLLGKGGFGEVYLGKPDSIHLVAVKKLMDSLKTGVQQFKTELKVLSRFRHDNLLPLVGYSSDGPHFCIVYQYMSNGSLEDRLACLDGTPPLCAETRLSIAKGTARGIVHLHTAEETPLIHRDIKSANVLLNENFEPKLGDFGFARLGPSNPDNSSVLTTTVIGTSAYMAPEAIRFEISEKLDTFSYGVVLLELMSGQKPFDQDREETDLVTYVDDNFDEENSLDLADPKAGEWPAASFEKLFLIAGKCVEQKKKKRPLMKEILPDIEQL